jgi:hypothetical protein
MRNKKWRCGMKVKRKEGKHPMEQSPIEPKSIVHIDFKIKVILIVFATAIITASIVTPTNVEKYDAILGTVLTHVDGNRVYGQPVVLYDGDNPESITVQIVDNPESITVQIVEYTFDGKTFTWFDANKSMTFTKGKLSEIALYNYDEPIWYEISYIKQESVMGTNYGVIEAHMVVPTINYKGNNTGTLEWRDQQ